MNPETDMSDFVRRGASKITLGEVKRIAASLPAIREEAAGIEESEYPALRAQIEFLAEVLADFNAGNFDALPFAAAAETAFALQYLLKEVDLIPDFVPDIGLVDDATVVRVVLVRHAADLGKHPSAGALDWSGIAG